MLLLPQVTLCCVATTFHEASAAAVARSAQGCHFAAIRFLSDRIPSGLPSGTEYIGIPPFKSLDAYSHFMLKELHRYIETPFVLSVQWDGFIADVAAWENGFLQWDYIGALWPQFDTDKVGNGGFSLRSQHLLQSTAKANLVAMEVEDTSICRDNRRLLESQFKIRFAPPEVAQRFSYEAQRPPNATFGFHGIFNMASHMTPAEHESLWSRMKRDQKDIIPSLQRTIAWLQHQGRWHEATSFQQRLIGLKAA